MEVHQQHLKQVIAHPQHGWLLHNDVVAAALGLSASTLRGYKRFNELVDGKHYVDQDKKLYWSRDGLLRLCPIAKQNLSRHPEKADRIQAFWDAVERHQPGQQSPIVQAQPTQIQWQKPEPIQRQQVAQSTRIEQPQRLMLAERPAVQEVAWQLGTTETMVAEVVEPCLQRESELGYYRPDDSTSQLIWDAYKALSHSGSVSTTGAFGHVNNGVSLSRSHSQDTYHGNYESTFVHGDQVINHYHITQIGDVGDRSTNHYQPLPQAQHAQLKPLKAEGFAVSEHTYRTGALLVMLLTIGVGAATSFLLTARLDNEFKRSRNTTNPEWVRSY